jgi:hypothetical protein
MHVNSVARRGEDDLRTTCRPLTKHKGCRMLRFSTVDWSIRIRMHQGTKEKQWYLSYNLEDHSHDLL